MNYPLKTLSPDSKIWVFLGSRLLTADEESTIINTTCTFLETWTAHKQDLKSGTAVMHQQFLIIAVDENVTGASGCSIDKLFQFIKVTEKALNISLLDRLRVAYRKGNERGYENEIINCSISDFESKIGNGEVNHDTIVFNTLVESLNDLNSKFELPLSETWLSRYLKKEKQEN